MIPTTIIAVLIFLIFLELYLIHTQAFYVNKRFGLLFLISTILPVMTFLIAHKEDRLRLLLFSFILLHYSILLFVISKQYRNINNYLIKKSLVPQRFENKDFTQVHWDGDIGLEWWDEKLSKEPSWFDHLLSFLLLSLPLLLTGIIYYIIENGS